MYQRRPWTSQSAPPPHIPTPRISNGENTEDENDEDILLVKGLKIGDFLENMSKYPEPLSTTRSRIFTPRAETFDETVQV